VRANAKKYLAMLGIASMLGAGAVVAGATAASAAGEPKISYCHWTNGGHYNYLTTAVDVFYNAGHLNHQGNKDVYPKGSFTKPNGQVVTWPDQGDQSLLATACGGARVDNDATASATTTPGTCLAKGSVTFAIENATWDDHNDTSDGSRDATATAGHAFANGDDHFTVTYTIPPPTDWKDAACQPTFEVAKVCGNVKITYHNNSKWDRWPDYRIEGDGVVAQDAGSGPYYTPVLVKSGETKVILDHDFAEDYNGGSAMVTYQDILGAERDIDSAAQTITVDTNCAPPAPVTIPVPAAPGVTDLCGIGNATWKLPGNGNNVTWKLEQNGDMVATADNGYTFPGGKSTHNFGKAPETNTAACPVVLASVGVAAPVLTPPTCTAAGKLSYTDAVGYSWNRTDNHGNVVLTAIAKPGFTLVGTTSWTYTAAQLAKLSGANACPPAVVPPAVNPPTGEGVKHTAPPAAPVVEGVKHEAARTLPRTGSESGLYGAAGLLLLMGGSGLVLATRKRTIED
jgi:LPXTG-motif cell wall-anchored protein